MDSGFLRCPILCAKYGRQLGRESSLWGLVVSNHEKLVDAAQMQQTVLGCNNIACIML